MKHYHIITYGCQMNEYDSDRMKSILQRLGYVEKSDYKNCDLVLLNTCHIREKAAEKVYSELGRINMEKRKMAKEEKNMIIIMAGCVSQAEGDEVFKRAPYVNIVVGPESYHNLTDMILKAEIGDSNLINLDFTPDEKFDKLQEENMLNQSGISSFISIQEGCDKFCLFCVVPYTRGAEFSRKPSDIIEEIKKNVDNGSKEIVLLGQNVNAYHGVSQHGLTWRLSDLIAKVAEIDGVKRIRYTTSHPCDMTDDLIAIHGNEKKLMPLLNLPVQSGSNDILKKMNRKHTRDEYFEIMNKLRSVRNDIIFSSDFIVGFPGETDKDFDDTIDLVKKVGFYSQSFSFKYSPRPGTPAAEMDQIDEAIKSERLHILQDILKKQVSNFNATMMGKVVPVLFDNKNAKFENQISGRSEFNQIVLVDGIDASNKESMIGNIINVEIARINNNSLGGVLKE
jgi:tRNA-2-methylthio-N6-dimethylallyladenosine synthase